MYIWLNPAYNTGKKKTSGDNISIKVDNNTKIIIGRIQNQKELFRSNIVKTTYNEIQKREILKIINESKNPKVRVWINNSVKNEIKLANQILITIYWELG